MKQNSRNLKVVTEGTLEHHFLYDAHAALSKTKHAHTAQT